MTARPNDDKAERRPPPRGKAKRDDAGKAPPLRRIAPALSAAEADAEVSRPTLARPADDSDDPTKGEWLFKQAETVLGPVTAIVLVERIKAGELSADTPIARDGQPFKPMKLVALFREAYEATLEAKRRVDDERKHASAMRRSLIARVIVFGLMILVPAAAGAFAGHTVMVLQPWDKTADWIAKAPPLVDLPPRPPEVVKVASNTPSSSSGANAGNEERDDPEPLDAHGERHSRTSHSVKHDDKGTGADKGDKEKTDKEKKEEAAADKAADKGFVKELTNEQATAPLKDGGVKSALVACFKTEVESNPDISPPLNLAYTITEEGRAANVELTNRELRGRPVQECVKKALTLARWPRFEGERKNVSVPFNFKKPVKPVGGVVTGTK